MKDGILILVTKFNIQEMYQCIPIIFIFIDGEFFLSLLN